ncbi:MAG: FAD-binding protein [Gammaproteobacteria bacterium]|nr:FAD-binding protein [Gammaproteobacteria bacterium]
MMAAGVLADLTALVGAINVKTDPADCFVYGYDNSRKHSLPDAVVFATTEEQIQGIVRVCRAHRLPLVARGRGTGTAGAAIPLRGGVVLALERMNKILTVDPANRILRVQPGATNQAVQEAAAVHGFFWPPDPTSAAYCSVGGNLAVNAGGPRAVKYGTVRENTLGLRAVTGAGERIRTGVNTTKGVVGYDLTRLIIGSEGTLAIITEATLKLTPLADARRTLCAVYADMHGAAQAVSRIMAQPVTPCALEFLDGAALALIRGHGETLPADAGGLLLIEVDGPLTAMPEAIARLSDAAGGPGLRALTVAQTAEEAAKLWALRKALSPALRELAPNKLNEDVVVPVSRIPELIEGLQTLSAQFGIPIVNFGHAGNGNIHVNLLYDSQNAEQERKARPCLGAVFDLVLGLGGTLSGEHGVGREKRDYVDREIEPAALALMRAIKKDFDPDGILNPDKLFPLHP